MSEKARKVLTAVLFALLFIGAALSARQLHSYGAAKDAYDQAQQMAFHTQPASTQTTQPEETAEPTTQPTQPETTQPEQTQPPMDEHAKQLTQTDLQQLRGVNPDVLGWIYIPDTAVSYPLMYSTEAEQYLYQSWDGQQNRAGSIFLEHQNKTDFTDFNTIIYGHNMKNGSMFGDLVSYWQQEFADRHPYVYLVTDRGISRYAVFAAYEAGVQSNTYRLYFADDAQKQACVAEYLGQSLVQMPAVADGTAPILTLSTCTGTGTYETRWVVQAVLTEHWDQ